MMIRQKKFLRTIGVFSALVIVGLILSYTFGNRWSGGDISMLSTDSIPNYAIVFPQEKVNRIDLVISPSDWGKMMDDLKAHFGEQQDGMMPMPPHGERPDSGEFQRPHFAPPDSNHRMGGMPPPDFNGERDTLHKFRHHPGMMGGMPAGQNNFTPVFVTCTLFFNGNRWDSVGFRLKGNSSLMTSWMQGIKKFPFRLDFNRYKNSPRNTSFYGFRKLSFSSNNNDRSLLREKLTSDILIGAAVKAAKTAFYRVYIDYGEGTVYAGLYTAVEIIEDSMLKTQFGSNTGNCYKPEGQSASFVAPFDKESFEKKTNKKGKDWSDVEKMFSVVNSSVRESNPTQWRKELESVFDVPAFLTWLAVNTTIQNWDSYGSMAHNYYLYHNPSSDKLVWIPWDHNEAMGSRGQDLSMSLGEVTSEWPLIRYLMDQPAYQAIYKDALKTFIFNTFNSDSIDNRILYYQNLISPYVIGADGEQKGFSFIRSSDDFINALDEIKKHVENRNRIARQYLGL